MRLQIKVYLIAAFLAVLCAGISILGCQTSQVSVSDIPIQGAITHVRESDNTSNAEIDILIEKDFKGNLPKDVESITVKGPQAMLPPAQPRKSIKLDSKIAGKYVGVYKNKILKVKLKVFRKKDKLYGGGFLFGDGIELLPVAENQFIGISNNIGKFRLTFSEDEKGRVEGLNIDIGFSRLKYGKTKWF